MPRALVTGGAGFVGSHLCERLLRDGWDVVCVDSLTTGSRANLDDVLAHPRFTFVEADVADGIEIEGRVDHVLHLASPASPRAYLAKPIETLRTGSEGTRAALELARRDDAVFLLTSTSEVYGDPAVHPQPESYWGNVNPIGPRSVYDESKRYAEALTMAYRREYGLEVRVARIFNTYGPRMRREDGRAVPTFIDQALRGEPLTIHGDGAQTRSLCWVDDLVDGLVRLLLSPHAGPINIGNPEEVKILELAREITSIVGSVSEIEFVDRPVDDPDVRCPDITLARSLLGWEPHVSMRSGLERMVAWARLAWPI